MDGMKAFISSIIAQAAMPSLASSRLSPSGAKLHATLAFGARHGRHPQTWSASIVIVVMGSSVWGALHSGQQ